MYEFYDMQKLRKILSNRNSQPIYIGKYNKLMFCYKHKILIYTNFNQHQVYLYT